jgi:hypothetical protein
MLPQHQALAVGQRIAMSPTASDATALTVHPFDPE